MNLKSIILCTVLASGLFPALPACREQNSEPLPSLSGQAESQNSISLKTGDSVELTTDGLTLEFLEIKEDSRCPRNASCIQEGKVTAVFRIFNPQTNETTTFQLTLKTLQPALAIQNIDGFRIKLNRVSPYPDTETAKSDRLYNVELVVEPNQ